MPFSPPRPLAAAVIALLGVWACSLHEGGDGAAIDGVDAAAPDVTIPAEDGGEAGGDAALDVESVDAPLDAPDGDSVSSDPCIGPCPGTCDAGRCFIACTEAMPCGNVLCPSNVPCTLTCVGQNACDNVTCKDCTVLCDGFHGCNGNVACGGAKCEVKCCSATDACKGTVTCNAASCAIACDDGGACKSAPTCDGGACPDAAVACGD